MSDPQKALREWLGARLRERGPRSGLELAAALGVHDDAITRMKCLDDGKERRRIDAHHIPLMAEFFGEWPPGFEHMDENEEAADMVAKAKKTSGRGRKTRQHSTKDVVVQGVEGPVTVVDKSVNVVGDDNTLGGDGRSMDQAAVELMGRINEAIDEVYRAEKVDLSLAELGRVAIVQHAAILSLCEDAEEYPHAIAIMRQRLRRKLKAGL